MGGKEGVLEEGKNEGLDKYDTGDNDASGLARASIGYFMHFFVA